MQLPLGALEPYEAALYTGSAKNTLMAYVGFKDGPDNYRLATRYPFPFFFTPRDLDAWLQKYPYRGDPPGGRPAPGARLPPPPRVQEVAPVEITVRRRIYPRPAAKAAAAFAAAAAAAARKDRP
ncbi:hypothetical protein GXW78_18210 [Roseomonas terrae]|uniref:Uncharacterized protein n=2 Tax=Neoroseomonas terrae TaxID=424799 RepID=A0ABS5EKR3_9PROT|nr:hypothetical protein [Neoroseomonas terrae]